MGGAERVLIGIMEKAGEIIHGVTCGAGMPYRLGDIAAKFGIFYYPIISSARAFKTLLRFISLSGLRIKVKQKQDDFPFSR